MDNKIKSNCYHPNSLVQGIGKNAFFCLSIAQNLLLKPIVMPSLWRLSAWRKTIKVLRYS